MNVIKTTRFLSPDRLLLSIFIVLKFLISLLPVNYGIFRDELYFLAMSNRLGLGYVDVPPLAPFFLAVNRFLLGDSIYALHFLPALSGALFLWLTYRLVKKLGGNNYALLLALSAVLLAPFFVYTDSTFTYDTFSKLIWLLFSYLMIRLIQTENPRYWIYLGAAAGIGLLLKITILYLASGWVVGLLLTRQRRLLWRWETLGGGVLALLIFSPYLIWQFQHGFITLEYYRHYTGKVVEFSPPGYLLFQIGAINAATIIIWLRGLYNPLFHPRGKVYRSAGIAYLVILVLSFLFHAKPDLILPFYALLFAFGAVRLGEILKERRQPWRLYAAVTLIVFMGIFCLPMVRPVLPAATYIRLYAGLSSATKEEYNQTSPLPQILADRFGWEEMTAKVAEVYRSLPEADQPKTCILVGNYGEAGAIEFYGKKYNLPLPPVSGHYQYHIWGPSRFNGEITIAIGVSKTFLEKNFKTVETNTNFSHPYAMPYENQPIYLCRDPYQPFSEMKTWYKWLD